MQGGCRIKLSEKIENTAVRFGMDSGISFWYVIERISSAAGSVLHITGELSLYKGGRSRNVIRINFGGSYRKNLCTGSKTCKNTAVPGENVA